MFLSCKYNSNYVYYKDNLQMSVYIVISNAMVKQLLACVGRGLGVQPPASPWSLHSAGMDGWRSTEGAGEGRSPERSKELWACKCYIIRIRC